MPDQLKFYFRIGTCKIQQRYILTVMAFLALFNAFAMRDNLSIAITNMVRIEENDTVHLKYILEHHNTMCPLNVTDDDDGSFFIEDFEEVSVNQSDSVYYRFQWTQQEQGIILSSFHWGYLLSSLPSGLLAQKFGGKYVLAFGIVFNGILSMLIPACVRSGGSHSLIAIRMLMGIAQGPIFPACLAMFSSWVPLKERCAIISMAYCGITVIWFWQSTQF